MIETLLTVLAFAPVYLGLGLFGYYSAVTHVDRLLDIDEPEGPPEILRTTKAELLDGKALSAEEIDRIDDWDEFEE
jgi:hypothetical protein